MALNLMLYGPTTGKSVCYSVNVHLYSIPIVSVAEVRAEACTVLIRKCL